VVSAGENGDGQCNVDAWTQVETVCRPPQSETARRR
jgi:hypothetical protein